MCVPVPGYEIKNTFVREGLCVREEQIGLGKKEISILVSPKLLKIASLSQAHFKGFVWYYPVTMKNSFA